MRLELLRHRQERAHTCLPACLRIALHYLGRDIPEQELAAGCGTRRLGTTLRGAMEALEALGCDAVEIDRGGVDELAAYLTDDRPVVAFLRMEDVGTGLTGSHAVVVAGLSPAGVTVLNPSSGAEEALETERFLRAWSGHGGQGIVILDVG
jgi:ABC-type bacteriocin/lantibiotic exporter with double-glycine peptidase domain